MKIELRENVIYESFNDKKDMMEKILKMVIESDVDKILYKGDPCEINYKLMKKILLENYLQKINPDDVKNMYLCALKDDNKKFCIIYKTI